MKKSQRLRNFNPDEADQSECYWDRDLMDEEFQYHTYRAGRSASRRRENTRGVQRNTASDADE
jgi:hypothetical protein